MRFLNPSASSASKLNSSSNPFSGMAKVAESKLRRTVRIKGIPSGGGEIDSWL